MNIDELKRKLLETKMCRECVNKAIGLVADYAQDAYVQGYERGYESGLKKEAKKG